MKKIITILICIVMLTGCGGEKEKMVCTYENTTEGNVYTSVVNVEIKNDIVKNATAVMTYESEDLAETMCGIFNATSDAKRNVKCDGKEITIKNYHKSLTDNKKITKEKFIDYITNEKYICEEVTYLVASFNMSTIMEFMIL